MPYVTCPRCRSPKAWLRRSHVLYCPTCRLYIDPANPDVTMRPHENRAGSIWRKRPLKEST